MKTGRVVLASLLLAAVSACSPEGEPAQPSAAAESTSGQAAPGHRPSFLLVVIDTLRADAVSAYGAVEGTTPFIDALASEGLRHGDGAKARP